MAERLRRLLLLPLLLWLAAAFPAAATTTDAAIQSLLAGTSAAGPAACTNPGEDRLARVLCLGRIRVGVRSDYAGFGQRRSGGSGTEWRGYEIDLARALAAQLGVVLELVAVTPANRIAMLVEGRVDVVVGTMGHTALRDTQIRFIRPHYYQSRTVIIGDHRVIVETEEDLRGRTVCVSIGNADTARIAGDGARLLIFDSPAQMLDALRMDICTLAMHDDAFFNASFADPAFRQRFAPKLVISALPWGMATLRNDNLARMLDLISMGWHAEGRFLALARPHAIGTDFLEEQQSVWQLEGCRDPLGGPMALCLEPPADVTLLPTAMAGRVEAFERWLHEALGLGVTFPMLKSKIALELFVRGILISLVLFVGSLFSTLAFGVAFAAALCSRRVAARLAARAVTGLLQGSPLVLLLFFGYAAVSVIVPYSTTVPVLLSIVMIGLYNGSHAAGAIADAHASLSPATGGDAATFRRALQLASVQIMSFLVNATKSTSIASMIGVPELLNALTDITSFTSERVMTYAFLLVFYASLVIVVVRAARLLQRRLQA